MKVSAGAERLGGDCGGCVGGLQPTHKNLSIKIFHSGKKKKTLTDGDDTATRHPVAHSDREIRRINSERRAIEMGEEAALRARGPRLDLVCACACVCVMGRWWG